MAIPAKRFSCVLSVKGYRNSKILRQNWETGSGFFRKPPRKKGYKKCLRENKAETKQAQKSKD